MIRFVAIAFLVFCMCAQKFEPALKEGKRERGRKCEKGKQERVKEAAYAFCFAAKIKHAIPMQKGNFFFTNIPMGRERPSPAGGSPCELRATCDLLLQFKVISVSCNLHKDRQFTIYSSPHVAAQLLLSIAQKMAFKVLITNFGSD